MKSFNACSHTELVKLLETIRDTLFFDFDKQEYNPDKEWSGADISESVALAINDFIPQFVGDIDGIKLVTDI